MDPLSIVTGSLGAATSCYKVRSRLRALACLKSLISRPNQIVTILYSFISEARVVDANLNALLDEVKSLHQVLNTVEQSLKHDALVGLRRDDNSSLWDTIEVLMTDCQGTLDRLKTMLEKIQETSAGKPSFFRKGKKQVKWNVKTKDIESFQHQIYSHYNGMQITLGTINVLVYLLR
jgi:hypothetical protein